MENAFLVGLDNDGHFILAPTTNRKAVYKLLANLSDGDFLKNLHLSDYAAYAKEEHLLTAAESEYEEFLSQIQTRGFVEIATPYN